MKITQFKTGELAGLTPDHELDLLFGASSRLVNYSDEWETLREYFPNAQRIYFTSSGHFINEKIEDSKAVYTGIRLENPQAHFEIETFQVHETKNALETGRKMGASIHEKVSGVIILSDSQGVNGSELIQGFNESNKYGIPIIGGMAGDGTRFEDTRIWINEKTIRGQIVLIRLIGDSIQMKVGHDLGWKPMGLEFKITHSEGNELYELNHQNAYDTLYGLLQAADQTSFAKLTLYHPFALKGANDETIIRTPVFVDHDQKILRYAGDMPTGQTVQLMSSGVMDLLDSTVDLAEQFDKVQEENGLLMAISCVGRRIVLDHMSSEEFAELKSVFGENFAYFGFYSYGEFSNNGFDSMCQLHNQTLTIATLIEK
jgi:hypothetical protein